MTVSTYWKGLPPWAKGAVLLLILVALYFIAWRPVKRLVEKQRTNARLKEYEKNTIQLPNGGSLNAGSVAAEIYDAIHNNDWFGWTEDEDRIMDALQGVPQQYIHNVEQAYKQLFNKVLRDEVIDALSGSSWNSVKHLFN